MAVRLVIFSNRISIGLYIMAIRFANGLKIRELIIMMKPSIMIIVIRYDVNMFEIMKVIENVFAVYIIIGAIII